MSSAEKLVTELVALPSVNPAFLPPGDPHAGEQRVAEFVASVLAAAGLDVELREVLPGRANLLARLSPSGPVRSRVWLVPHFDTVNAAEAQFRPCRRAGRLYARGACDTKGSVAMMVEALCALAARGPRPGRTEITFAGVIDEENAQAGSRALAADGRKAELAIVGEPTRLQLVTAHKGSMWLRLETRGKAAHGARPELGVNAVREMARVVTLLEGAYGRALRRRKHPLLGCPTVNVGAIQGGTQPNIVPDKCAIEVDRRTLPGETEAGVKREIAGLLRKHKLKAGYRSFKQGICPPLETNPKRPLVAGFLHSLGQRGARGVDYFCDAAILGRGGVPSVVFGPGDIAQAHTADEWLCLSELDRSVRMLLTFLQTLP
jgi:acetylornithine deacetylase/succinyl-diaminopimelate desuccinylase-like protein